MGNKHDKSKNVKRSKSKQDNNYLEEDEEFFDDNMPKKKLKHFNSDNIGLEHNRLISQVKSDPFVDYSILKELGKGSFATVHLVKHNISGAIRAMKAIQKIIDNDEENNEYEIINEINILMKMDQVQHIII